LLFRAKIFDGSGLNPLQIKVTELLMKNDKATVQAIPFESAAMFPHTPTVGKKA
jgi:hypothetical protein